MTEYREFGCEDMLRFNNVNLDKLTETVTNPPQKKTNHTIPDQTRCNEMS